MMINQSSQTKPKSRRELYEEQYEASKRGGSRFFPDYLVHDAIAMSAVVAIIFILAVLFPASSEAPANPAGQAYNPRPEWYFLFMFEFLRLFYFIPEPMAAVVIPTGAIIVLLLVPFFSRGGFNRTWAKRVPALVIGVIAVLFILYLEIGGALSAPTAPVSAAPPQPGATYGQLVSAGQSSYAVNCASCHGQKGEGGDAPALIGPKASLAKYKNAGMLLEFTAAGMPLTSPGSLSRQDYLDILAFLLVQGEQISAGAVFDEGKLSSLTLK
jgi:menaquinol-cytochrome c reductase cytochrome b/c subunit